MGHKRTATVKERPVLISDPTMEGFAQVPEALLPLFHKHLNKAEIITFMALIRWQTHGGKYSRPVSNIAEVTGMSEGTIRNALSNLVKKGFLKRESGGHKGHTAEYSLAVRGNSVINWLPKARMERQGKGSKASRKASSKASLEASPNNDAIRNTQKLTETPIPTPNDQAAAEIDDLLREFGF